MGYTTSKKNKSRSEAIEPKANRRLLPPAPPPAPEGMGVTLKKLRKGGCAIGQLREGFGVGVTEGGLVPSPENEKRLALSQASFRAGEGTRTHTP